MCVDRKSEKTIEELPEPGETLLAGSIGRPDSQAPRLRNLRYC
jgi:hypothetical protein